MWRAQQIMGGLLLESNTQSYIVDVRIIIIIMTLLKYMYIFQLQEASIRPACQRTLIRVCVHSAAPAKWWA